MTDLWLLIFQKMEKSSPSIYKDVHVVLGLKTKIVDESNIKHHSFARTGCIPLHCVIAIIVAVYIASVSFIEAKEK